MPYRLVGEKRNRELGIYLGYPLEELAAELEISHQALSEHLRRANKMLAGDQVGNSDRDGLTH